MQFFVFRSTGNSSSLLISMGSNLWRFNRFVDAVFATSPDGSLDSSSRRLTFRFELPLPLSMLSNAFFLPRRFDCDSKLSANIKCNCFAQKCIRPFTFCAILPMFYIPLDADSAAVDRVDFLPPRLSAAAVLLVVCSKVCVLCDAVLLLKCPSVTAESKWLTDSAIDDTSTSTVYQQTYPTQ